MVDEQGSGGLAVGAGDADGLGVGVSSGEFDFRDDGSALLGELTHQGSRRGYAGAFHHLIGIENQLRSMAILLERDAALIEHIFIFVGDGAIVAHEDIHPFRLAEDGCTATALPGA